MNKTEGLTTDIENNSLAIQRKRSQQKANDIKLEGNPNPIMCAIIESNTTEMERQIANIKLDLILLQVKLSSTLAEL